MHQKDRASVSPAFSAVMRARDSVAPARIAAVTPAIVGASSSTEGDAAQPVCSRSSLQRRSATSDVPPRSKKFSSGESGSMSSTRSKCESPGSRATIPRGRSLWSRRASPLPPRLRGSRRGWSGCAARSCSEQGDRSPRRAPPRSERFPLCVVGSSLTFRISSGTCAAEPRLPRSLRSAA